MGRPVEWWVLDLAGDPVPGDPDGVVWLGGVWQEVADDAELAAIRLRALMEDPTAGAGGTLASAVPRLRWDSRLLGSAPTDAA